MKKYLITVLFIGISLSSKAQVGIGTTSPNTSAILDVESDSKGFLIPRMTGVERGRISNPVDGLMVYCKDCCETGIISFYRSPYWVNTVPCLDYDSDSDGVPNTEDVDDDNDGIADSLECPLDFATFSGLNLNENSGSPFVTNSSVAGSLPTTVTVNPPVIFNPGNTNVSVITGTNVSSSSDIRVLRIQDNVYSTNDTSTVKIDFSSSNSIRIFADNSIARSNINQLDQFTFSPINPSSGFSWTIVESTDAIITTNGNNITVRQDPSAGTTDFAQFEIETTNTADGFTVEYVCLSSGAGFNSGQFLFSFGCQDTDGDGTPDYLDTDSDNDGCSDALEAGMTSSTDANFVFTSTAGENGLTDELETSPDNNITTLTPNVSPTTDNGVHTCN